MKAQVCNENPVKSSQKKKNTYPPIKSYTNESYYKRNNPTNGNKSGQMKNTGKSLGGKACSGSFHQKPRGSIAGVTKTGRFKKGKNNAKKGLLKGGIQRERASETLWKNKDQSAWKEGTGTTTSLTPPTLGGE